MTRRSDLMLEDLIGCTHEPETPISDGGEIVGWRCRCGGTHSEERSAQAKLIEVQRRPFEEDESEPRPLDEENT